MSWEEMAWRRHWCLFRGFFRMNASGNRSKSRCRTFAPTAQMSRKTTPSREWQPGYWVTLEGDCIVVGHSMGGRVAMEVARQAPGQVARLVLANTGHHPLKPGETDKRQAKIDQGHADFPAMIRGWLPPMMAASRHQDTGLIANLTEMALSIGPVVHERQIRALIDRPDASEYLPDLTCPILLITGSEDVWSPEDQHRQMRDMARHATLQVVEDAGHFLPIEKPAVITRLITDWIKSEEAFRE